MTYDAWKLRSPWDDEPEPCECGEDDCACAEDEALDRGDWLLEQKRDREMEFASLNFKKGDDNA